MLLANETYRSFAPLRMTTKRNGCHPEHSEGSVRVEFVQGPDNLTAFLCKIVRNLSLKRCSRNSAEKRKSNYGVCIDELDECLSSANTVESELEFGELSGTLDKFIAQLDKTNQCLFVRRYWFMDSYESLSKSTGIKEQAIRTRLSRIRSNLKKFLAEQEVI